MLIWFKINPVIQIIVNPWYAKKNLTILKIIKPFILRIGLVFNSTKAIGVKIKSTRFFKGLKKTKKLEHWTFINNVVFLISCKQYVIKSKMRVESYMDYRRAKMFKGGVNRWLGQLATETSIDWWFTKHVQDKLYR